MTLTRTQARVLVAQDLAGNHFVQGVVSSTSTTGLTVVQLRDDAFTDDVGLYVDHYIYTPVSAADDLERRIRTWTPSTGAIVPHRPWGVAPTNASAAEIHRFPPSDVNRAINDGLARCFYMDWITVTPVANTRLYTVNVANTWITHPNQFVSAWWHVTDSNDPDALDGIPNAEFEQDGSVIRLRINPPPYSDSGFDIQVQVRHPYAALTTEAATTDCPELWLRAAARVAFYQNYRRRASSNKERDRFVLEERESEREALHLANQYQVNNAKKMNTRAPFHPWGSGRPRIPWG